MSMNNSASTHVMHGQYGSRGGDQGLSTFFLQ